MIMATALIAFISVGFTSCSKDEKEPELDISLILGKWYSVVAGQIDTRYYIEFNRDKTFSYSCFLDDFSDIHGVYDLISGEKTTLAEYNYLEYGPEITGKTFDATLFKMKATGFKGDSRITQIWVYHYYPSSGGDECLLVILTNSEGIWTTGEVFRKPKN